MMENSPYQKFLETLLSKASTPEDKDFIGCSPSQPMTLCPTSPPLVSGSLVNSKKEGKQAMFIGKSSPTSKRKCPFGESSKCLGKRCMQNSPLANKDQKTMSGKTTPVLMNGSGLNLARKKSNETLKKTGIEYASKLFKEICPKLTPTFIFAITDPSDKYPPIIYDLFVENEELVFFGVKPVLVNHTRPGIKQEKVLIVSLHGTYGGMLTKVRKMLLSMNLEEESRLKICYDGSTPGLSWFRPKEDIGIFAYDEYGLLATCLQRLGTHVLIPPLSTL